MPKRRGRGEGGVEVLPSGKFRAIVCTTSPEGKRTRSSKSFATKAEALAWLRQTQQDGPAQPGTVADWLTSWLEIHKTRVGTSAYRLDSGTVARQIQPVLGSLKLRDLTPLVIERFLAGLADTSASNRHVTGRTLRMALNAAVKSGVLPRSPMRDVKIASAPKPETRSLTELELTQLIQAADQLGHGALFRLWVDAGLRPGELLGLQWHDFDGRQIHVRRSVEINTGKLKEPKTKGSKRRIVLSEHTLVLLRLAVVGKPTDPIFPTTTGLRWLQRNFRRTVWGPVIERANLHDVSPYILRHTCATLLLRAGVNLRIVSERLGHQDVTTTLKAYSHCLPGDQERAAEVICRYLPPHAIPTPNPDTDQ
jgi:integrase